MHGQLPHAGADHHEAPGGHQAAAATRGVSRGRQGRRRLPLLPPHPPTRHGREAAGEGVHGRQRRQPLLQRRAARGQLPASRLRQGRPPLPRRGGKPPPPSAGAAGTCIEDLLHVRHHQPIQLPRLPRVRVGREGRPVPACGYEMATQSQYVAAPAPAQPEQGAATATTGYVQGGMTYTVTDDLAVTPMSAISSISSIKGSMEDRDLDGAARVSVEKM